jgi:cytoskeletal protein CcmA (bactofilin family)
LVVVDRSGISNISSKLIINEVLNMFSNSNSDDLNSPESLSENRKPRRSLLHDGIVIKGDWHSDGIVEFGGKITGDLTVDVLVVTGTGKVDGNVRARSVTVEGHLNGTIAAVDVILASTAVFTGEIVAERIQIDFGANVEGRLKATAKDTA